MPTPAMRQFLPLSDGGALIAIDRGHLLAFAGPDQIVATALMFRLYDHAIADLSPGVPPQRRRIATLVAFPGPGILDCVEMVTRAREGDRLTVATEAGPSDAPPALLGRFYFEIAMEGRRRAYWPMPGYFTADFLDRVRRFQDGAGTAAEQADYQAFKHELVGRLIGAPYGRLFHAREIAA
ncbi:MAG: hypothetical protein IT562_24280 [Alphaproteobacteria bacterium]|nr:hypothetical protein [Alphaproteobacteria bacterium]